MRRCRPIVGRLDSQKWLARRKSRTRGGLWRGPPSWPILEAMAGANLFDLQRLCWHRFKREFDEATAVECGDFSQTKPVSLSNTASLLKAGRSANRSDTGNTWSHRSGRLSSAFSLFVLSSPPLLLLIFARTWANFSSICRGCCCCCCWCGVRFCPHVGVTPGPTLCYRPPTF